MVDQKLPSSASLVYQLWLQHIRTQTHSAPLKQQVEQNAPYQNPTG